MKDFAVFPLSAGGEVAINKAEISAVSDVPHGNEERQALIYLTSGASFCVGCNVVRVLSVLGASKEHVARQRLHSQDVEIAIEKMKHEGNLRRQKSMLGSVRNVLGLSDE